jgi:hypothetical protein
MDQQLSSRSLGEGIKLNFYAEIANISHSSENTNVTCTAFTAMFFGDPLVFNNHITVDNYYQRVEDWFWAPLILMFTLKGSQNTETF